MGKIKSTFPNILLSLTTVCVIAGIALATANKYTEMPIAVTKTAELQKAIRNVTPEFDNRPSEEQYKIAIAGGDSLTVYPVTKEGKYVGCAVESYSKKGFSGLIRVLVGFDAEGHLHDYSVLEHSETPGLGTKMEAWFRMDKNQQNIIGRDMNKGLLKVTKDGGDVDAITAATISTRAFLEAVNLAFYAWQNHMDNQNVLDNHSIEVN